ncbi:MAG: hypothetical protein ACLQG3_14540 [Terracidiphilus sp.]
MNPLSPADAVRLNLLYDLLDANYVALRESARIHRETILRGLLAPALLADTNLIVLSKSIWTAWAEIQRILNPEPEAATEPAPETAPPPPETMQ